ncbi:MAG: poly[(R)-3-hydroxyalkanoate] polymerase subunit PhaC [Pseudonocardiales bacterium]|nr:poly[(R)-3-hydroxyalkanoate] polymerase subunit PhaC [Pseudonocardiales bacterium]
MTKNPPAPPVDEITATEVIQGANPFVGLTTGQIAGAAGRWALSFGKHPTVPVSELLSWGGAEAKVLAGVSKLEPAPGDKRFTDPAWQRALWRRLAQSYLLTRDTVLGSVDELGLDPKSANRARFALSQITEAAAPTNTLLGNPAALRRAGQTRGRSLLDGARHMYYDVRRNGAMPSQVDTRPFRVGETVAATKGAVIHRTPMYELIQYTPATPKVHALPTVIVPPQVNRYYFLDLAPQRSFVEYAVSRGIQTFMISWRNPGPEEREWGLDAYAQASVEAMRVAAEISGVAQVNAVGFCAGGMTLAMILSHLAATGDELINAATLGVTMLDTEADSTLNMFASRRAVQAAISKSRRKGVLDGKELSRVFAWVRPNDLVWNYWVANYLLGHNPPAFDVLAWNKDATNLPATLHAQFLHLWVDNALMNPNTIEVLGSKVDLGQVKTDLYAVGALTDHLVPWQSAYAATRAFGSDVRFVLSNSGHIQALINPPGNPKASFLVAGSTPENPDEWLAGAERSPGRRWVDWADWTIARSGAERSRPRRVGDRLHPVLEIAPGRYVRE